MCDALTVAEQPCGSGRSLELRYKYRTLGPSGLMGRLCAR
jgi:hypothetical protein